MKVAKSLVNLATPDKETFTSRPLDRVSQSPYLRSTLRFNPETGKTEWMPDFMFIPSETPYTKKNVGMRVSMDNGITFTSAPYLRTKLPDPYGYLENHFDVYPINGADSSLEISGQMTESYHAQARIWNARGRKCNRWVWRNSADRESMTYERRLSPKEIVLPSYSDKPKVIQFVEERLRALFSFIRVLTLPRERIQLLSIPVEDEQETIAPISLERAIFHKPRHWYYGVQTR